MIFVKKTTVFLLACLLILSPATGFFVAQASPAAASIAAKRGDTVRVSFTAVNETPVFVRGFGLDFRDAYDTDAFEWVSGSWGETITENALLVSVNPESEAVFGAKEEIAISGEVFVLVLRVKETAPLASYPIALSLRQGGGCVLSTATVTVHECEASETVCYEGESHWNPCRTASCTARFNEGAHDFSADGWNADVHWKKCSVCGLADEKTEGPHVHDPADNPLCSLCPFEKLPFVVGDLDGNGEVDMDDAIYLLFHTFYEDDYFLNQPCDFDKSGAVDMDDAIYLLFHTFYEDDYPLV